MSEEENKEIPNADAVPSPLERLKERLAASLEVKPSECEDKTALHELVEQAVGLREAKPKVEEEPPSLPADPESINRITSREIKNMREVSAKTSDPQTPFSERLGTSIIKAYFDFKDMLLPAKGKDYCNINGHECAHCGQRFAAAPVKSTSKQ